MTLDITIGKYHGLQLILADEHFVQIVERCPESEEPICDPAFTLWSTESYRSGGFGFWDFFLKGTEEMKELYLKLRENPFTNDEDTAFLLPFKKEIEDLKEGDEMSELDKDRLKWFKYWTLKAIELYGKDAVINFK